MNKNKDNYSWLAMNTLHEIPAPREGAKRIVALVKENGLVTGYQLSDGNAVSKEKGVDLAKQGQIEGVGISSRNGREYLKSLPDQNDANNLSSLPTIQQNFEQGGIH